MTADIDCYSPLCLIVGGLLGIAYFGFLRWMLNRQPRPAVNEHLESAYRRFRSRQRLSWVMVAFGALWFLQIRVEERSSFAWGPNALENLFSKASVQIRNPAGK